MYLQWQKCPVPNFRAAGQTQAKMHRFEDEKSDTFIFSHKLCLHKTGVCVKNTT